VIIAKRLAILFTNAISCMVILVDLQLEAKEAMVMLPAGELTAPGQRMQSKEHHLTLNLPYYLA